MIKQCQRCGGDFDAKNNAKYCLTCRTVVRKEQVRAGGARWLAAHRDKARENGRRSYEKNRDYYLAKSRQRYIAIRDKRDKMRADERKKRQIAKLREKLQAAAEKRQAELEKYKKLYQPPSMFDDVGIPIPSCLANLEKPKEVIK